MSTLPAGTRVMIVEDEAIIAMSAEDMIEEMGGVVAGTAICLRDALALVEELAFDVALLDINLNGETSFAIADRLVELDRPFIFATGYGEAILPPLHARAPIIAKPYRAEGLAAALVRALGA